MSQDNKPESDDGSSKLLKVPKPDLGSSTINNNIDSKNGSQGGEEDLGQYDLRSFTPITRQKIENVSSSKTLLSYTFLETSREKHYNLDYPNDTERLESLQLDPTSRFYARRRKRTIDLKKLLPYKIEGPTEYARFLSHIVTHLYIAVKSLDLQGALSISAKDLAAIRDLAGISDVDLALETNLFELSESNQLQREDSFDMESEGYFIANDVDESGSDNDYENDDEGEEESVEQDDDMDSGGTFEDHSAGQIRKSPKSAATVSVKIWTQELMTWLKVKYDMPLSLRIALIKVYYAICTSRGQKLSLKIYANAFRELSKDTKLIKSQGLILPWKPIYHILHQMLHPVEKPSESLDSHLVMKILERASIFFPSEELPEIYSTIASYFSPRQAKWVSIVLRLLPLKFDEGGRESINDIRHYIPSIFNMWVQFDDSSNFSGFLATVADAALNELNDNPKSVSYLKLGEYGLFTETEMRYMFTYLLNGLLINKSKYGSQVINHVLSVVGAIVLSITSNNSNSNNEMSPIISFIQSLLNSIETFVHPTNSGSWSVHIAEMISNLVHWVHKRYNREREVDGKCYDIPNEYKLDDKTINQFIEIVLPIVRIGLHSKHDQATRLYIPCLDSLAHMNSELVLENVLLDIYDSLDSVISNHRIFLALRIISMLARYFATTPIYRVHLTRIMLMVVPGIDSNDLTKTGHTVDLLTTIAAFVPIYDLTNGTGDINVAMMYTEMHLESLRTNLYLKASSKPIVKFETTEESELEALKNSTVAFPTIMERVLERYFILLQNLPDMTHATEVDVQLVDALPRLFSLVTEASSDEIFRAMRSQIFKFVFENTIHSVDSSVASLCGEVIRREPLYFKTICPQFLDKIREALADVSGDAHNVLEVSPRDQPFVWYMSIFIDMTAEANGHILDCGKELTDLSLEVMLNIRGYGTSFYAAHLTAGVLRALTQIKIKEARLISPAFTARENVSALCWGGFLLDEYRFSKENLSFDWFVPEQKHITFAIDFFSSHVKAALEFFTKTISSYDASVNSVKKQQIVNHIRGHLFYLGFSISGMSSLFDPSFEENIPSLTAHESQTLKSRLVLLQEIRNMEGQLSFEDLQIEDLQANFKQIVSNLENVELDQANNLSPSNSYDVKMSSTEEISDKSSSSTEILKEGNETAQAFSPTPQLSLDLGDQDLNSTSSVDGSRSETPSKVEEDEFNINPGMTFRQRKLYSSNYFFGDDLETRRANPQYIRLHKIRHLIGRSLHLINKFLTANFMDNDKLMCIFLLILRVWFIDVGSSRVFHASDSKTKFTHMKYLLNLDDIRKPFTRLGFARRLEAYQQLRVSLHATSRTQTKLDRILLEDILKLSTSTYDTVSGSAINAILDIMKRTSGSYSLIVRSMFKFFSKAIEDKDSKKISSILRVFKMKRLNVRIQNDCFNVEKFVTLLHKSLSVDDIEVDDLVDTLLRGVEENVTPPSEVCIIDENAVDAIRPSDSKIDLEIKAVTIAKEKKRKLFVSKLIHFQEKLVSLAKSYKHWRILNSCLSSVAMLQQSSEIPLNSSVIELFAESSFSEYAFISLVSLKGISNAVLRIQVKERYGKDIRNYMDFDSLRRDFSIVNTEMVDGKLYSEKFRDELNNETPNYFIDAEGGKGWLFWGKSMTVGHNERSFPSTISLEDRMTMEVLNKFITKKWLIYIIQLGIADNESASSFFSDDVDAIGSLIFLISNDIIKSLTYQEILECIDELYVKDDNASHINLFQIIAGLLLADSFTKPEYISIRDDFLVKFLTKVLEQDLNPGNSNIWGSFSTWLTFQMDCRRIKRVMDVFLKFRVDSHTNYPVRDTIRLRYLTEMYLSKSFSQSNECEELLQMCLENISVDYLDLRTGIGNLMCDLVVAYPRDTYGNAEKYIESVNSNDLSFYKSSAPKGLVDVTRKAFDKVLEMYPSVEHLAPQEIVKSQFFYGAQTLLVWIEVAMRFTRSPIRDLLVSHVMPLLNLLIGMKEVCQIGNLDPLRVVIKLSKVRFSPPELELILQMVEKYFNGTLNSVQTLILGEFTVVLIFKNLFLLTDEQRNRFFEMTNQRLYHDVPIIREAAGAILSGIIHMSPPKQGAQFIAKCTKDYTKKLDTIRKKYRKQGFKNIPSQEMNQLHGVTLGLGALINAYPYVSPPPQWMPKVMSILATKCAGLPGIVGKSAKNTFSTIRKTRQDTWHIDSKVFTPEQMESMEGVLWTSYYV